MRHPLSLPLYPYIYPGWICEQHKWSGMKIWLSYNGCSGFYLFDARDRLFRIIMSIPCFLMPWLLQSPGHQQARFWQYRIGNMSSCSIVYLVCFCWTQSNIWYKKVNTSFIIFKVIQYVQSQHVLHIARVHVEFRHTQLFNGIIMPIVWHHVTKLQYAGITKQNNGYHVMPHIYLF